MTHSYFIRKTLGIKDKNITFDINVVEENINNQKHLIYFGKLTYQPRGCQNCGVKNCSSADIVKNGTKESTIKLTQINFKPVLLKLKKQRFYCKHCSTTFIATTPLVNRHCFISNIIKATISMELTELQSMKLIGQHLSVSSHTIQRQLHAVGNSLTQGYEYLPSHISLDEFKSVKNVSGAMSLLFIDAQTHKAIDIIENRQQSYLFDYFMRYSYKVRETVQTITMDMYSPFLKVIRECFPNAEIIIDRFHIVQLLNRALNQVRIDEMNKIRYTRPKDYRKFKRQWKLLLKNTEDIDYNRFFTHRLYDGLVSEYTMIEYLLSISKILRQAYETVNALKSALKNRNFERFKHILKEAKNKTYPRKVRTALTTLEKYLEPIQNAFIYTLSNGPIEGMNHKIKNIKRSGYGYRNFIHLKHRILISFNLIISDRNKKSVYYKEQTA